MTSVARTSPAVLVPALVSAGVVMGRGFGFCAARIRENDGDAALTRRSAGNSRARFARCFVRCFARCSGRNAAQDQPNQRTGGKAKNDPCGHDVALGSKGVSGQRMGRNR